MKNKLTDLNDILFAQLERLGDDDLKPEALAAEVSRTEAVVSVADKIVENARLQLDAMKVVAEHGEKLQKHLPAIAKSTGLVAIAATSAESHA